MASSRGLVRRSKSAVNVRSMIWPRATVDGLDGIQGCRIPWPWSAVEMDMASLLVVPSACKSGGARIVHDADSATGKTHRRLESQPPSDPEHHHCRNDGEVRKMETGSWQCGVPRWSVDDTGPCSRLCPSKARPRSIEFLHIPRIANMQESLFSPEADTADTTDTIVMATLGTDAGPS